MSNDTQILYQRGGVIITTYIGGEHQSLTITPKRLEARNFPIVNLYLRTIQGVFLQRTISGKHIVLDVPEELKERLMLTNEEASKMDLEDRMEWYRKNACCVQIENELDEHTKFALILAHLDQCFREIYGVRGEYKEIITKCFSLIRIAEKDIPVVNTAPVSADDSISINNGSVKEFVCLVNNHDKNFLPYPIIDETDFSDNVTVNISLDLSTVEVINSKLEKYNLKLIEAERKVRMVKIELAA